MQIENKSQEKQTNLQTPPKSQETAKKEILWPMFNLN